MEEHSGTSPRIPHPESAPSGKRLGVTRLRVSSGVCPLCSRVPLKPHWTVSLTAFLFLDTVTLSHPRLQPVSVVFCRTWRKKKKKNWAPMFHFFFFFLFAISQIPNKPINNNCKDLKLSSVSFHSVLVRLFQNSRFCRKGEKKIKEKRSNGLSSWAFSFFSRHRCYWRLFALQVFSPVIF